MSEERFIQKIRKKYPYAYSLVSYHMWTWIYRNILNQKWD